MKKSKGFTLVELVIVIVIVGILSMISVPIYRGHVQRSVAAEGKALVVEVAAAQEIYKTRTQSWYSTDEGNVQNVNTELGIDARKNSYFTSFYYKIDSEKEFYVISNGVGKAAGMEIILTWTDDAPTIVTLNGNQI